MALPKIRGTQIGLRKPELLEKLKSEMAAATYEYEEKRGQIGGVIDSRGTYHVVEGHHRMAAALEIHYETGDDRPVLALLQWGHWTPRKSPPRDSRPFPSRYRWQAFRNWIGF
jgi:hypothetical protein